MDIMKISTHFVGSGHPTLFRVFLVKLMRVFSDWMALFSHFLVFLFIFMKSQEVPGTYWGVLGIYCGFPCHDDKGFNVLNDL